MRWVFDKYTGCGNNFIIFNNQSKTFPLKNPTVIPHLCNRYSGLDADGVLLLENSDQADARMRIFNSDGSEAEMCGNGLRCFAKWLMAKSFHQSIFYIEVMDKILKAYPINNSVCIELSQPTNLQWNIPLMLENTLLNVHHVNTGVPHTLLFVDEVDKIDLPSLGFSIRHHSLWKPNGTNVTIVQLMEVRQLKIRTFERGIEGETLACGTGAVAAALAAAHLFNYVSPITVETRSQKKLTIDFLHHMGHFSCVSLTGAAQWIFQGEVELSENETPSSFSIASNSCYSVKS